MPHIQIIYLVIKTATKMANKHQRCFLLNVEHLFEVWYKPANLNNMLHINRAWMSTLGELTPCFCSPRCCTGRGPWLALEQQPWPWNLTRSHSQVAQGNLSNFLSLQSKYGCGSSPSFCPGSMNGSSSYLSKENAPPPPAQNQGDSCVKGRDKASTLQAIRTYWAALLLSWPLASQFYDRSERLFYCSPWNLLSTQPLFPASPPQPLLPFLLQPLLYTNRPYAHSIAQPQ